MGGVPTSRIGEGREEDWAAAGWDSRSRWAANENARTLPDDKVNVLQGMKRAEPFVERSDFDRHRLN